MDLSLSILLLSSLIQTLLIIISTLFCRSLTTEKGWTGRMQEGARQNYVIYVSKKKEKKTRIRLLPPAIITITTITSIHFLSLSLLYRRCRLQLLCVTRIPCFWKWWWKNAHNGRKAAWVSAPSFVRSFVCSGFWW